MFRFRLCDLQTGVKFQLLHFEGLMDFMQTRDIDYRCDDVQFARLSRLQ